MIVIGEVKYLLLGLHVSLGRRPFTVSVRSDHGPKVADRVRDESEGHVSLAIDHQRSLQKQGLSCPSFTIKPLSRKVKVFVDGISVNRSL